MKKYGITCKCGSRVVQVADSYQDICDKNGWEYSNGRFICPDCKKKSKVKPAEIKESKKFEDTETA